MKQNFFYLIALLGISTSLFVGCKTDDEPNENSSPLPYAIVGGMDDISESDGEKSIKIFMTNLPNSKAAQPITIDFEVSGTAVAGVDYELLTPSPVTVPVGENTGLVKIKIINDLLAEEKETITVQVKSTSLSVAKSPVSLPRTINIKENDKPITATLSQKELTGKEGDTVRFMVNLSEALDTEVSFGIVEMGGNTADFKILNSLPVVIKGNEGKKDVEIKIVLLKDDQLEHTETLKFKVTQFVANGTFDKDSVVTVKGEDNSLSAPAKGLSFSLTWNKAVDLDLKLWRIVTIPGGKVDTVAAGDINAMGETFETQTIEGTDLNGYYLVEINYLTGNEAVDYVLNSIGDTETLNTKKSGTIPVADQEKRMFIYKIGKTNYDYTIEKL